MTWDCPYEPGHFDAIWCSPDCTQYSRARTRAKTPRDLVKADALVKRCLGLIQTLRPKVWFLENPDSGLLRTRPFMQALSYVRVDYCCYQDPALYRKKDCYLDKCCKLATTAMRSESSHRWQTRCDCAKRTKERRWRPAIL